MEASTVYMIYGKDAAAMTRSLLDAYGIEERVKDKERIILKPNLVTPSRAEEGATTHTEIMSALIECLHDLGKTDIAIAEGSWVGASTEEAFRHCGCLEIARRLGVKLIDTKKDSFRTLEYDGMRMEVSEAILSCDYLINLPVLKGHCQTRMTAAMKNLKGCLSDRSKREFHRMGLMKPIAALNMLVRPDLTIVDSLSGDLDFEEGGNPVETDRMMAGDDPVAIDILGASLMGYAADDIPYIPIVLEYSGRNLSLEDIEVRELNRPEAGTARPSGAVGRLAGYTDPSDACSACLASLIHALKRLEEDGDISRLGGRKIAVGQGWRGRTMEIGSGTCCSGAAHGVRGCPPSASDILRMLEDL